MAKKEEIILAFSELQEDSTVPKSIKAKVKDILELLNGPEEDSIKMNKILDVLENIVNDVNIQPFTRTQIYNIISLLES